MAAAIVAAKPVPASPSTPRPAEAARGTKALRIAAATWFATAALGQLTFACYVVGFYGRSTLAGRYDDWNRVLPHGYAPGATMANAVLASHLAVVVAVVVSGLLQLVPPVRRRWPALHRWNGRVYLVAIAIAALGGLWLTWRRGEPTIGDLPQHLAITLNALLMLAFGALALRHAIARRIDAHRRFALRLFLATSGVWFFRIGLMAWLVVRGGPAGFDPETFTGPVLTVLAFGQYLVPLAIAEIYFAVQARGGGAARVAMAITLHALAALTVAGSAAAAALMWWPRRYARRVVYPPRMAVIDVVKPRGLALMFHWRRVRATLVIATVMALLFGLHWQSDFLGLWLRVVGIALAAMIAFGVLEQWPRRLPAFVGRWALQVIAVAATIPFVTYWIYVGSTPDGAPPFWEVGDRRSGFAALTVSGLLLAPWVALSALVRQKDAIARHQALQFALERSELERQAVDARLHLLRAQVAPHFLFNTLANVQALVDTGSPQASAVLGSLIAYLRAAVPRLDESSTTLRQELALVQAYLELMVMRIPDRLQFAIRCDDDARDLRCPPMTLMTLVENAVKHGIDPSEDGGRIDLEIRRDDDRCVVVVTDTGLGLREATSAGTGTGLATLRERLALVFGDAATLTLADHAPRGTRATLAFPARPVAAP